MPAFFSPPAAFRLPAEQGEETRLAMLGRTERHAPELRPALQASFETEGFSEFIAFVRQHSPYLNRTLEMHPEVWLDLYERGPEAAVRAIYERFQGMDAAPRLRRQKQQMALACGLADIAKLWDWEAVTAALSDFASHAVQTCLETLLLKAAQQQMLKDATRHGIFVLGMGKLGGRELNYSSDIDLILFYDPERLVYQGRQSPQHFMTRLAQELVAMMQDRTADGYVFRTDLRLRPDPSSTPLAVSTKAALRYYESVGQNWERAAMIKARVIAGDHQTGEAFLKDLQPFMWRTHLDFAAVADILSIKRQMQSRYEEAINPYGHNVKTGRGGIREIEFLAQIYQLIWGGRMPSLRRRKTVEVLDLLVAHDLLNPRIAARLKRSYAFFRTVEHRLQMRGDQQTHTLPADEPGMAQLAGFLGYPTTSQLVTTLSRHLRRVHHHFTRAFEDTAAPLSGGGTLVFTGVEHDADTLEELRRMGFVTPEPISAAIQDWHKGNRRCTRTKRSRELLTELVPEILEALADTVNPDEAFQHFDGFMTNLPSGVQLFSLFASNRQLLRLTADIMGSAPTLGRTLSQNPNLFDAVLSGNFFGPLPSAEAMREERGHWLRLGRDAEDRLNRLATYQKEKMFQAGVQLLKGLITAEQAGYFLSDLADVIMEWVVESACEEFVLQYGRLPGAGLIVLGMGKLGSRELTFGSDLDLNFLYDASDDAASDGEKSLQAGAYFNRLTQRIVGRLTALTRHGRLYEVDTRLRPFGKDGPMAVSLTGFERYHTESAWLFERLALTRARVVFAQGDGAARTQALLHQLLRRPVAHADVATAILDMRRRIEESFKPHSAWDVKHIHGGLMDVDFLLLFHALTEPGLLDAAQPYEIRRLPERMQDARAAATLKEAGELQTTLLFFLRLCSNGSLDEATAPHALKFLLAQACGLPDFATLKASLLDAQAAVRSLFAAKLNQGADGISTHAAT